MSISDTIRWHRVTAAILTLLFAVAAHAVPSSISYQAYLTNSVGTPVSGFLGMGVRIIDVATASTLYEETHANVEVTNGLLQLAIGAGNPVSGNFDVSLFQDSGAAIELEIELEIEGETLTPRRPLRSVPSAQAAEDAAALSGSPASSFVVLDSAEIQNIADGTLVIDGISGNIDTSGEYRYDAQRTYRYAVTPDRFIEESSHAGTWLLAAGGLYRHASDTFTRAHAGINVPAGARLKLLSCSYYDNTTTGAITNLIARLQQRTPGSTTSVTVWGMLSRATTNASASTGLSTGSAATYVPDLEVPAGTPLVIELQFSTNIVSSALRFYGCEIEYTLDRVSSP